MQFNPDQRRRLQTHLARDRAEVLLEALQSAHTEALGNPPQAEDRRRQLSDLAVRRALRSADRLVNSLNACLELVEQEESEDPGRSGWNFQEPEDED